MKRRWFLFFLMKSISQRKGRVIIASASVALAVSVMTGMIAITAGIKGKLGEEIKAYGANIIVSPDKGDYLARSALEEISKLKNVEEATGQVLGRAFVQGSAIEVIGLDFGRLKKGWRIFGRLPGKKGEVLAGINLKDTLKLEDGKAVDLDDSGAYGPGSEQGRKFIVSGFLERGGPEDNALVMSIADASELLGLEGRLSAVLVMGRPGELAGVVGEIRKMLPAASAKTVRQVALPEESLLSKVQLLMALVTIVVLFAAAVSVAATMGANALERREEIGLMKAIGAARNDISLFYRAEAAMIGLTGGIAGLALGVLAVEAVSKTAFSSLITVPFYLPFFSLSAGLLLSVLASYFPVRDAMKYNPAEILRGE